MPGVALCSPLSAPWSLLSADGGLGGLVLLMASLTWKLFFGGQGLLSALCCLLSADAGRPGGFGGSLS
jgi:hypothetical protein